METVNFKNTMMILLIAGLTLVHQNSKAGENTIGKLNVLDKKVYISLYDSTNNNEKLQMAYGLYLSAVTRETDNDFPGAIKDLTKSIELNPKFAEAYDKRGVVYTKMLNYEKALKDLNKAIQLKSHYAEAYSHRGIVHYILQNFDKAIADYSLAIEANPNYAKAYFNRGLARLMLEDAEGAKIDMEHAVELNFSDADNILNHFNNSNNN